MHGVDVKGVWMSVREGDTEGHIQAAKKQKTIDRRILSDIDGYGSDGGDGSYCGPR
jgi:hypothetical protein